MDAIILANSLVYTSPHKDKQGAHKADKNWKKFLDTLDWTKRSNKGKKQSKEKLLKAFKSARIPIKKGES